MRRRFAWAAMSLAFFACTAAAGASSGGPPPASDDAGALSMQNIDGAAEGLVNELGSAAVRLPVATALGATLALRPRRRGAPRRHPAVVETQIVLAIVGAIIMLVVGSSLARAFGIVGVASLIRYRSKINDPKDAVVMLSALAVGLASGTGLYALATFSTLFLVTVLWVIEGFETQKRIFELSVQVGDRTAEFRPRIEAILRRFDARSELRAFSEQKVTYLVTAPPAMDTDRVSDYLTSLAPGSDVAIEWKENTKAELRERAGA